MSQHLPLGTFGIAWVIVFLSKDPADLISALVRAIRRAGAFCRIRPDLFIIHLFRLRYNVTIILYPNRLRNGKIKQKGGTMFSKDDMRLAIRSELFGLAVAIVFALIMFVPLLLK